MISWSQERLRLSTKRTSIKSLPDTPEEIPISADTVFLLGYMNSTPVTAALIRQWTLADPVLSKVEAHVMRG